MTVVLPRPGEPDRDFERPADRARLERTAGALASRGFDVQIADSAKEARRLVLEKIPEGAQVHTAMSQTTRELGIAAELDDSGRFESVRSQLNALDRQTQGREMRKLAAAPDYVVGSAHAVTDAGEIIVGSGSGSQLGAYAYAGGHVILVIGHQKLVSDVDEGLRRVREYSLPLEHARMQGLGRPGSLLAKALIISYEPSARISVILVPETLGF
jgi:hypothetical protein